MKLKLEFRYKCEVEFKEEEVKTLKDNLKKDRFILFMSKTINYILLEDDGRSEWGEVVDFDYKLED